MEVEMNRFLSLMKRVETLAADWKVLLFVRTSQVKIFTHGV